MKLIAQTIKGYEYMHSKELAFFTPNASAKVQIRSVKS